MTSKEKVIIAAIALQNEKRKLVAAIEMEGAWHERLLLRARLPRAS
jgi:hypothetical protein